MSSDDRWAGRQAGWPDGRYRLHSLTPLHSVSFQYTTRSGYLAPERRGTLPLPSAPGSNRWKVTTCRRGQVTPCDPIDPNRSRATPLTPDNVLVIRWVILARCCRAMVCECSPDTRCRCQAELGALFAVWIHQPECSGYHPRRLSEIEVQPGGRPRITWTRTPWARTVMAPRCRPSNPQGWFESCRGGGLRRGGGPIFIARTMGKLAAVTRNCFSTVHPWRPGCSPRWSTRPRESPVGAGATGADLTAPRARGAGMVDSGEAPW